LWQEVSAGAALQYRHMTDHRTVFLMYHELEEPGRPLCQAEPGYVRYVLHSSDFRDQMHSLKDKDWRGISVGEALGQKPGSVVITFDDGSETDLISAAPILRDLGFGATFYITAGFIGKPGYLNPSQLRELFALGFEIGCHSMTHAYLTDLDDAGLNREMAEAKSELEQFISRPVEHFSCPGGRYNQRVSEFARSAGFKTVATSRLQSNSASTDPFALGRVAVMRTTSLKGFHDLCNGRGLWRRNLLTQLRGAARELLGNSVYDRLRTALLPPNSPQ
jgi:peptidoglycan/xylan/chitin deacetylase (PgdA/CDA1 family)